MSWIHAHGPFPIAVGDTVGTLAMIVFALWWMGDLRVWQSVVLMTLFFGSLSILAHRAFRVSTPITRWIYRA